MRIKPGYKTTEVGEIPEEWGFGTLEAFAATKEDCVQTGPFGAQLHASDYVLEGVPLIRINNLSDGRIVTDDIVFVGEEKANGLTRYSIKPGDVVFSRVGSVGRAAVANDDHAGWLISGQMLRVRLGNPEIDTSFLGYTITTNWFQKALASRLVGSTRKSINTEILRNLPLVVPSLPEQQKIASILSTVDDAIQKTDEIIAKSRQLKKGLMQRLLTNGIGHTKYKMTEIGEIPEEWEVTQVGDVCEVVTGGTPDTKHPEYFGGSVKWLKSGDIEGSRIWDTEERITELGLERSAAKLHPPGGVAIALSGRGLTRGKTVVVAEPMACSQSVAIMLPSPRLIPEFLHYYLSSKYMQIRNLTGHLDRSGLNLSMIQKIRVPIAPSQEQERIVAVLLRADDKLLFEEQKNSKFQVLKQGLMQVLLTGKVRVKVA